MSKIFFITIFIEVNILLIIFVLNIGELGFSYYIFEKHLYMFSEVLELLF